MTKISSLFLAAASLVVLGACDGGSSYKKPVVVLCTGLYQKEKVLL